MQVQLRHYQLRAIDGLRERMRAGKRRLLLVSPTGSGKTTIASQIIESAKSRGGTVLFLAHRTELIEQCSGRLDTFDVDHGIIQGDHWRYRPHLSVQVASVQTLVRREEKPPATLIVVDEAHHARAGTYAKILDAYPGAVVLGLSATPWRQDGKGLGELFEDVVVAATPAELIAEGHLCHFDGFGFENPDLSGVHTKGGDYAEDELAEAVGTTRIIGGIVERWQAHAAGVRTVVFAVNVAHSKQIVERFRAAGVAAEHVDGMTPKAQRAAILQRLASGETRVVSNCALLTEGWDLPALECCILARPTKSLGLYLQCVGRVLRPAPGKAKARIHDHAGCLIHHGLPDEDQDYSLGADVKKRARDPACRQCAKCLRIYPRSERACPECGFVEVSVGADEPVEREIHETESEALAIEEIRRLRAASVDEKASEYKRLLAVAERKGYQRGWAAHQYRATFGVWPRFPNGTLERVQASLYPIVPLAKLRELEARISAERAP